MIWGRGHRFGHTFREEGKEGGKFGREDRLLESRRSRDDSGHGTSMGLMLYHRNLRFSRVETRRFNGWEGEGGQSFVQV